MPVASFTGVTRTYPGLSHPAVDNLSFTIDSGEVLVIVGANGSGKTTAMRSCAGCVCPPRAGRSSSDSPSFRVGRTETGWASSCRSVGCLNDSGSARP